MVVEYLCSPKIEATSYFEASIKPQDLTSYSSSLET
jgi:hypothetical protein